MTKPDNDNGKQFHISLNKYDRDALDYMRARFGTSFSGAIRTCIRAAAIQAGFNGPLNQGE